jgi:plasmid stability protein
METTQLNIAQFPSDLHTWLKIEAARRGVRMRDLVVEILTVAKSGTGA